MAINQAVAKAHEKTLKRYDRWLEDEITNLQVHIRHRREKGRAVATYEARLKELRRCRGRIQDIAREELNR